MVTQQKKKMSPYASMVRQKEFQQLSRPERKAAVAGFEQSREEIRGNQENARQRKISRRTIRRQAESAKKFFSDALKKNSSESKQAKAGRQFIRGATGHLKVKSGRGIRGLVRLPQVQATEWSDMGLVFGSGFKNYQSRNVFPSSLRDRRLHPQEKAEIDAAIQKVRLFGVNIPQPSQLPNNLKKKISDEQNPQEG